MNNQKEIEKTQAARSLMKHSLDSDPELKYGYQSNIAMLLHDKYGITGYETRNQAALDILEMIFGDYYGTDKKQQ